MKKLLITISFILATCTVFAQQYVRDIVVTDTAAIWTDVRAFGNLSSAVSRIGSKNQTLYITRQETLQKNTTIPENIHLLFSRHGRVGVPSGMKITLNGAITAENYKIFNGTGTIAGSPKNVYFQTGWANTTQLTNQVTIPMSGTFGGLNRVYVHRAYNASQSDLVEADTAGSAFSVYLPSSPRDGARVGFLDSNATFASKVLTVFGNGASIGGMASFDLDIDGMYTEVVYSSKTNDWRFNIVPSSGTLVGFGTANQVLAMNSSADGYVWNSTDDILRSVYGRGTAGQSLISTTTGYTWVGLNTTLTPVKVSINATNINGTANREYWISTANSNKTFNLPTVPNDNTEIALWDFNSTFNNSTRYLRVKSGTHGIINASITNMNFDIKDMYVVLKYANASGKWGMKAIPTK